MPKDTWCSIRCRWVMHDEVTHGSILEKYDTTAYSLFCACVHCVEQKRQALLACANLEHYLELKAGITQFEQSVGVYKFEKHRLTKSCKLCRNPHAWFCPKCHKNCDIREDELTCDEFKKLQHLICTDCTFEGRQ